MWCNSHLTGNSICIRGISRREASLVNVHCSTSCCCTYIMKKSRPAPHIRRRRLGVGMELHPQFASTGHAARRRRLSAFVIHVKSLTRVAKFIQPYTQHMHFGCTAAFYPSSFPGASSGEYFSSSHRKVYARNFISLVRSALMEKFQSAKSIFACLCFAGVCSSVVRVPHTFTCMYVCCGCNCFTALALDFRSAFE
jgi:hypothetical protein